MQGWDSLKLSIILTTIVPNTLTSFAPGDSTNGNNLAERVDLQGVFEDVHRGLDGLQHGDAKDHVQDD